MVLWADANEFRNWIATRRKVVKGLLYPKDFPAAMTRLPPRTNEYDQGLNGQCQIVDRGRRIQKNRHPVPTQIVGQRSPL
jgi:hypothetical protein